MYLKIKADCYTHILHVPDIRNVSTGWSVRGWEIYIYYKCGADTNTTICFDYKKDRDEACEEIYQALVAWEEKLG